jgi:hypothetical protein
MLVTYWSEDYATGCRSWAPAVPGDVLPETICRHPRFPAMCFLRRSVSIRCCRRRAAWDDWIFFTRCCRVPAISQGVKLLPTMCCLRWRAARDDWIYIYHARMPSSADQSRSEVISGDGMSALNSCCCRPHDEKDHGPEGGIPRDFFSTFKCCFNLGRRDHNILSVSFTFSRAMLAC